MADVMMVVRQSGEVTPFNASDAVAAVCDAYGYPIPRSLKARMGKSAKELLADGFTPNVVCAAMYAAVRRARPDLVATLALELQNAVIGQTLTGREWGAALAALDPESSTVYAALRGAF